MPMYDDEGRLLVSLARVDRIIDADGDTYVHVAEDYIDFYVSGAQFGRFDANGLCLAEYLRHCGDLDTYLRFRTNRIGIVVGNVDILDIVPGAVVWNEGGVDVDHRWEGVGAPNAFFVQGSDGSVGLGTGEPYAHHLNLYFAAPHNTTLGSDINRLVFTNHNEDTVNATLGEIHFDFYAAAVPSTFTLGLIAGYLTAPAGNGTGGLLFATKSNNAAVLPTERMRIDKDGKVFINDTANAFALGPSLTIDGAGQDGEYFTLQDSVDVGHGMTDLTDTDTFFRIRKKTNATGGAWVDAFSEDDYSLVLAGTVTAVNSVKTGNAIAPVIISGAKKSVAARVDMGANENVLVVRRGFGVNDGIFIIDADGDLFADGGVASTNMVTLFDDYEDAQLVRAFDLARSRGRAIKNQWDKFIHYNEDTLVELGVLGDRLENGGLTCITRLQQLHNGAIWQNYTGLQETKAVVEDHDQKLKVYEQAFKILGRALGIPPKELLALAN